jgi:integrase
LANQAKIYHISKEDYLEEFRKAHTKFSSVNRWKNTLKVKRYEDACLKALAQFCQECSMNPDELIQSRLEELKSSDFLIRAKAEDRLLAYHKELSRETPGEAINVFRKMKSFYRANYVTLQCRDPGYQIQRDFDYIPTREEIRKMCEIVPLETRVYLVTLAECCGRPGAVADIRWKDIKHDITTSLIPCQILLPHKVCLARRKYVSFIGADAVRLWRVYLETFEQLTDESPLFKGYCTCMPFPSFANKIPINRT